MATATESRPSWTSPASTQQGDERITLPGGARASQPSFSDNPSSGTRERAREVILAPPPGADIPPPHNRRREDGTKSASSMSPRQTTEIVESLQTFVERMQAMPNDKSSLIDNVKKFARTMQQRVAKLGGVATKNEDDQPATGERRSRNSFDCLQGDRPSFSCSLDGYRPDVDVVAPISVRPNAMELLWVCGDCGEHYPRARECPEQCRSCGAPRQNFYAPIED
jgi:rubrerythrin